MTTSSLINTARAASVALGLFVAVTVGSFAFVQFASAQVPGEDTSFQATVCRAFQESYSASQAMASSGAEASEMAPMLHDFAVEGWFGAACDVQYGEIGQP